MSAVVIHLTVFGNTRRVAKIIAEGLARGGEARAVSIDDLTPALLQEADLVVFGSPTHYQNLPQEVKAILQTLPKGILHDTRVAAFDTSVETWGPLMWMTASHRLLSKLRKLGGQKVTGPLTFAAERGEDPESGKRQDRLREGELERAKEWTAVIVECVSTGTAHRA